MPGSTVEHIVVHCEKCAANLRVPATSAGRSGKCPKCGGTIHVPAAAAPISNQPDNHHDAADDSIRFECESCGGSLKVKASAAGKRVKCPRCQSVLTVPQPSSATSVSGGDPDALDLLGKLGGGQAIAPAQATTSAAPSVRPCPECGSPIAARAKRCSKCGWKPRAAASSESGAPVA
jgi:predicted Zn finger-like uncharacterized protein